MQKDKEKKDLATLSFFFSIVGGYPALSTFSLLAIITGHIALGKIKRDPKKYCGKKTAVTGLILGYIGLLLALFNGYLNFKINQQLF